MSNQKVYYYHTTKLLATKMGVVPACTIALQKDGDTIKYGISICSKFDNFSKKYGREVALSRLNKGFGTMQVPESIKTQHENNDHKICMSQLYGLVESVVLKNKRWKKKVTKFNQGQKKRELPSLSSYDIYKNQS